VPAERRRTFRKLLSVLLLATGILLALSIDQGLQDDAAEVSATLLDDPQFSVIFGRNRMLLTGTTVSAEHEASLVQLVRDQLGQVELQTEFKPGLVLRPDWEVLSTRLLYLVAATNSVDASIDGNGIAIRGVSSDMDNYRKRLDFLRSALDEGMSIESDVLAVDKAASLDLMCQRNFSSFVNHAINFRQSMTSIRQSSYPLLDRLVEFAYECRRRQIVIVGHSDATGSESWNLQISRARAQAVADHLIQQGVAAERLVVEGLGSKDPVADNETAHGRELNRRVEIELR